jgi:hypothetical protein
MTRISVLFVIIVVTISSLCIVVGPRGVIGGDLHGVDVLEEAAILHGVIRFWMKLAMTLQGLVVVIRVIPATTWLLNRDFMIVLVGTLASIVVAAVAPLITVVSVVAVVVASITMIAVVVLTMVVAVVIAA